MSDDLPQVIRDMPKLSKYLHARPKWIQRSPEAYETGYTVEDYREMMSRIRETIGAAVSSDFIVGFCGETEEEFQLTCELVEECRFKNSFIFKYSERPGTKSETRMIDDIPDGIKKRRNNELLAIQNRISEEDNHPFLGETVQVLLSQQAGCQKRYGQDVLQLTGRTQCDRIVVFEGNRRQIGQMLAVGIYEVTPFTLMGTVLTEHVQGDVLQIGL